MCHWSVTPTAPWGRARTAAEAWVRGMIAVAEIERPEWMAECGMGELEMMEWDRWARAQLGADWRRRRMSVALQRGNARIILSGAARARSGRGV